MKRKISVLDLMRSPGIGNRMTSYMEAIDLAGIWADWKERSKKRIPGTHTLGKQFQTVEKKGSKSDG